MKEFFKNRTWDDYLGAIVVGLIAIGLIVFAIGYFWGFQPDNPNGIPIAADTDKINVRKVVRDDLGGLDVVYGLQNIVGDNLFKIAGEIDASFGALYAMVIVSLCGFSMIMLGLTITIVTIIISLIWSIVESKIKKKRS